MAQYYRTSADGGYAVTLRVRWLVGLLVCLLTRLISDSDDAIIIFEFYWWKSVKTDTDIRQWTLVH